MKLSPHEIKEKLLKALDKDYHVVDMPVVVEIIGILERTPITKETLETTRLGKYVNELRRKTTNEQVAKRAKDLVRKWRDMILPQTSAGSDGGVGINQNGARPSLSTGRIVSPALGRSLSPGSWSRNDPVSPALSQKRSQPTSPSSRICSLSPDSRLAVSPLSPRQIVSPGLSPRSQSVSRYNQSIQLPHSSGGESSLSSNAGTAGIPTSRGPEQSASTATAVPVPRPRGRPPNSSRNSLEAAVKSPPRPRGRPPLEHVDGEAPPRGRGRPPIDHSNDGGEAPRGRGRPPLDPSMKAEQRGRGRPPLTSPLSGAPRGRGRPPKNKNKFKKSAGSPETNPNSNLVPKNSPANKRLRKSSAEDEVGGDDIEETVAKKQKLNGVYDCKVPDLVNSTNEEALDDDPSQVPSDQIKIPKKRGRKKGSKNAPKKLPFESMDYEDVVKEKMASVVRNPKVKTTRELLECIQKESSLDNLRNKTLSSLGVDGDKPKSLTPSHKLLNRKKNETIVHDMIRSETEHIHKFLSSQNEAEDDFPSIEVNDYHYLHRDIKFEKKCDVEEPVDIASASASAPASISSVEFINDTSPAVVEEDIIVDVEKIDDSAEDSSPFKIKKKSETVEDILAKLPAINHDEILWSDSESPPGSTSGSDDDQDYEPPKIVVTKRDVDRLHNNHIEGINGNWNDGNLIENLNHGLIVPIGNISINGDNSARKPNPNKPNTQTDDQQGDDQLLVSNLNNVNQTNHDDNFREWQECVSKRSYNGELLHILPYVIID